MIDTVYVEIASALVTVGVAWGGARAGARSTTHELREFKSQSARDRLELKEMVKQHVADDDSERQRRALLEVSSERRLSRLETLVGDVHRKVGA